MRWTRILDRVIGGIRAPAARRVEPSNSDPNQLLSIEMFRQKIQPDSGIK